jgi:hypothetical protein
MVCNSEPRIPESELIEIENHKKISLGEKFKKDI